MSRSVRACGTWISRWCEGEAESSSKACWAATAVVHQGVQAGQQQLSASAKGTLALCSPSRGRPVASTVRSVLRGSRKAAYCLAAMACSRHGRGARTEEGYTCGKTK